MQENDKSQQIETPEEVMDKEQAEHTASLADRVAVLEDELAQAKEQLLRALAEAENVRRRVIKEKEEFSKYAITQFAREILTVGDNLARGLQSATGEEVQPEEAFKTLLEGIEMTERQFLSILEKFHITRLDPLGEKFDPSFHQAMFEVEHTGEPTGTVVQVLQVGYVLHDRLLRPALVGVAKGEVAKPTDIIV